MGAAPWRKEQCMKHFKWIGCFLLLALSISMASIANAEDDVLILLEKAIYTEETLGDLDEAVKIYQQILADSQAGRNIAAEALYRLGMCHQKSSRTVEAKSAFTKLAELYPEQVELIALTQNLGQNQLELQPAPWEDGEVLEFKVQTKGSQSGTGTYRVTRINSVAREGKQGWELKSYQGTLSRWDNAAVWFDSLNYNPGYSRLFTRMAGKDINAVYTSDGVYATTENAGQYSEKNVTLNRNVFDNAQIPEIFRCLPLKEGYRAVLPVFDSSNGSTYEAAVEVTAREEISVPAGTFDCFKIVLTHGPTKSTQWYWLTTDSHRYIVKSIYSGNQSMELNSISVADRNQPVHHKDLLAGFSLTLPPAWHIHRYMEAAQGTIFSIADPDGEADCMMTVTDIKDQSDSNVDQPIGDIGKLIDRTMSNTAKIYEAQFKDYHIRSGKLGNLHRLRPNDRTLYCRHESIDYGQGFRTLLLCHRQPGQDDTVPVRNRPGRI